MEPRQIIKTYLPLLQDLQVKVSERKGFSMTITCDDWDISVYLFAPGQAPRDGVHEHFHSGYSDDELNQKFISLEAFFAQACITTVTGVDCSISLN